VVPFDVSHSTWAFCQMSLADWCSLDFIGFEGDADRPSQNVRIACCCSVGQKTHPEVANLLLQVMDHRDSQPNNSRRKTVPQCDKSS